jgi:DNA-binding SARP family transcriptional activator
VVDVRLLGPVEIRAGARWLDLGPPQQRAVLAALAVDAGRPVMLRTLIDRVWDDAPPVGAKPALYAHITRIRQALDAAAATTADGPDSGGEPPARLFRRAGGYLLEVEPDQIDLRRFRRLASTARDPQRSDTDRVELLREALDLWRGVPLADLPGEWAARMRNNWQQQRLDAVVHWSHAQLRLGRTDEVIGALRDLAADHPRAEPLVGVLMRAFAAAGRDAEALDCYAAARTRLVHELGTEPGADLRAVHTAVLRGDLRAAARSRVTGGAPARPTGGRALPAQLPADVHAFTGRQDELAELDRLLAGPGPAGLPGLQGLPGRAGLAGPGGLAGPAAAAGAATAAGEPTAVVIAAISGTAGVGKTALAVRWAHRTRDRFPDGQLYVDLRGYDPEQPVSATDALAGFLTALGVPAAEIPPAVDDRAARFRTEITGRRLLLLLDNAATVDQVRPLLPGAASCFVLVTSRDSLAGLIARHGAHRLDLDLLPLPDAVTLLRTLLGGRVVAEPAAAATLAEQCARLPLALRVAAELAASRPATPLRQIVTDLADDRRRLDLLDAGGDRHTAVRAVFSWSYRHLPAHAAQAFRLLGIYPGPDLDPQATATLFDTSLDGARQLLDLLARAHLIQPARRHPADTGRYGMHDLLRAYATQLASAEDTD